MTLHIPHKPLALVGWAVGTLCLMLLLQRHFAYNYYYAEQWRMFRLDGAYAAGLFARPGGAVEYVATFLVQYFIRPYVGAACSALLWLGGALALRRILRKLGGEGHSYPLLYLLPGFAWIWASFGEAYHFEAELSFALVLGLAAGYVSLSRRWARIVLAYAGTAAGWWLVGPMALVFGALVVVAELSRGLRDRRQWLTFAPVAVWMFVPALVWGSSDACSVTWTQLLTPAAYWHPLVALPRLMWVAPLWVIAAAVLVAALRGRRAWGRPAWREAAYVAQIVVVCLIFWRGSNRYFVYKDYLIRQLDTLAAQGRWNDLLALPGFDPEGNYLLTSYQNLALARTGQLSEHLFDVPQCGLRGLWPEWNRMAPVSSQLSRVAYEMGNVALAQALAFEGMMGSERAVNPRLMVVLAKTNLINGQYRVAAKYLDLLGETLTYRTEAARLRRFLNNDRAVEADAELGPLRRCTKGLDGLTNEDRAPLDLWPILQSNPRYEGAAAYFGAASLFMKDLVRLKTLFPIIRANHPGEPLPRPYQEAAVMIYAKDHPDSLSVYGVAPEQLDRFASYYNALRGSEGDPMAANALRQSYGNSYWYYFTFAK